MFSAENLRIPLGNNERIKEAVLYEIFGDMAEYWKKHDSFKKMMLGEFQDQIEQGTFETMTGSARDFFIYFRESSSVNRSDTVTFEFDKSIESEIFYKTGAEVLIFGELNFTRFPPQRVIISDNGLDKQDILAQFKDSGIDTEVIYESELIPESECFYHSQRKSSDLKNIIKTKRLLSQDEKSAWITWRKTVINKLYGKRTSYGNLNQTDKRIVDEIADYFLARVVTEPQFDEKIKEKSLTESVSGINEKIAKIFLRSNL